MLIVSAPVLAVQPLRLGDAAAVKSGGNGVIWNWTRSKKVALRVIVTGIWAVVPASTFFGVVVGLNANVPRAPIRDTSSSGSWYGSGSVDVFQFRLPR